MAPPPPPDDAAARPGELASAILDVAGALIVVLDREGRIVRFNHACERATGWSLEEIVGLPFWELFLLPEEAGAVSEVFASLVAGRFPNAHENHWRTRSGGLRLIAWSNPALLDARGAVEHVVATGIDVTEARRAEAELRRHAARTQALADASRAFASALDYRSTLDTVVRSLGRLVGDSCLIRVLSDDGEWLEPVAFHHRDPRRDALIRSAHRESPQRADEGLTARVLRTGQPVRVPALTPEFVRAEMKPAYWPYLDAVASILIAPLAVRGRVFGHVTMLRDAPGPPYSEEDQVFLGDLATRAAESIENARLYGMAQAAVAARDDFLSIASHELRTPLTALKLAVQNLHRMQRSPGGASPEDVSRALGTAERQGARLEALVSGLLDVSRIQGGRLELALEEVDLSALVADVVAQFEEQLGEVGSAVQLRATGPVRGRWDRFRLTQVVTNLVSNSVKYGAGRPIEIEVASDGERARLAVRDHGIGIGPEDQAHIFQRFARAAPSRNYGGLGLGLYIVRRLAEAHGGSVRVDSALGEGSTFVVELPVAGPLRPELRPPSVH